MSNKQDSKDVKEITLYNFATLRNPEYLNKEALKKNPNYICYDPDFFRNICASDKEKLKSDKFKVTEFLDFELTQFLDYNAGNKKPKKEGGEVAYSDEDANDDDDLPIVLNRFFDKILNIYKNERNNFYKIYHLLEGKDDESNIKVELSNEKLFQEKIWRCFVYNIKKNDDFKQKEIAINLLRYFHLRNFKHLIDFESTDEKKENFEKLINGKIVIPEELFPKSETYFYGEKSKVSLKNTKPNRLFIYQHYLKVLQLRKIAAEDQDDSFKKEIDDLIIHTEKEISNENEEQNELFSQTTYIATIQTIQSQNYLLISISHPNQKVDDNIKNATLKFKAKGKDDEKLNAQVSNFSDEKSDLSKKIKKSKTEKDFYNFIYDWDLFFNLNTFSDFDPSKENAKDEFKFSLEVEYLNNEIAKTKSILALQDDELKYEGYGILSNETDFFGKAFKPSGYGIQLLGIADYRKVVSTISRYIPAEVAHIENVMASEFREKVTTKEISTEITEFESSETETEKLNETTTNDRFQMQNEIARILNDQKTNNINANVSAFGTGYSASLNTGSSTTNSKEESNKQATTTAKEITNKAVEKIVSKVKRERTVKTTEKFIDVNKYGFDNRGNNEHVSGVYRHINAVYRNKVHNYGKRLTYEFSIPEPALIHKLGIDNTELIKNLSKIHIPKLIESSSEITKESIDFLIKEFPEAGLEPFPSKIDIKNLTQNESKNINIDITNFIPKKITISGYWESKYSITPYAEKTGKDILGNTHIDGCKVNYGISGLFKVLVNTDVLYEDINDNNIEKQPSLDSPFFNSKYLNIIDKSINPIINNNTLIIDGNYKSYGLKIEIEYKPTEEYVDFWQSKQYKSIVEEYKKLFKTYSNSVKEKIKEYSLKKNSY